MYRQYKVSVKSSAVEFFLQLDDRRDFAISSPFYVAWLGPAGSGLNNLHCKPMIS